MKSLMNVLHNKRRNKKTGLFTYSCCVKIEAGTCSKLDSQIFI